MSGSNGKGSKVVRRRVPRRSGGRRVLAGQGNGWLLWVPEDDWRGLSDSERAALVEGQAALLEPARALTRPPRRDDLDQAVGCHAHGEGQRPGV